MIDDGETREQENSCGLFPGLMIMIFIRDRDVRSG